MKQIPKFNDYKIDKKGVVYSFAQKANHSKPKKPYIKSQYLRNGYLTVDLYKNGKQYKKYIHDLLLEIFIGKKPKGYECRHLDGNKINNNISNLRWGTRSENQMDRVKHGSHNRGEKHGMSKYTKEFVLKVRKMCKTKKRKDVAKKLNISVSTVTRLVTGSWKWLK